MKTKIFKTGLPIMAFLMAIAFAFATENKVEDTALITGYIQQANRCEAVSVDCGNNGGSDCLIGTSTPVYVLKLSETVCHTKMTRNF